MRKMRFYLCWLAAIVLSLPLQAEVYKYKDDQGRTVYSDTPPPKDRPYETVELQSINSQAPVTPQRQPPNRPAERRVDYSVSISTPPDGAQVPPGQRNLEVIARINPGLAAEHSAQLIMNGVAQGEPTSDPHWVIEEIFRGTHNFSVRILDAQGTVLSTSDPVTVHVIRPGINSPARRAP